ncbi:MAG TPA: hypothetical protein VFZ57_11060, partial [Thermoanaerobaculia bacterium]|nr:hypothetical protein [Thermoanaerobaculia bacterium]
MKGTLAVAAREIAERKLLFLGAFVVGLLPLGVFLIPVLRGNPREARSVAVLLVAATITVGFPLAFGATILVSDIAQKRLSFYFSRPLRAASIWAGKLLAALLISIACAFLVAAPVFFVEGESAFSSDTGGLFSRGFLSLILLGIPFLLLLAHAVASMARLRSAWIVLDFLLAVVFVVAITLCIRSLLFSGFWGFHEQWRSPERALWWLPVSVLAILLAASFVQVADGRTDARRSHGALSATLWGLTALLALPLVGLAWWVSSAAPGDIVAVEQGIQAAPRGSWVALAGKVRKRGSAGAAFLYDTASGRYLKLRGSGEVAFSADGARAAWVEERVGFFERERKADLFVADLASAKGVETGLTCSVWCRAALSASGRRLAVSDGSALEAYDISDPSNPKQLAAIRAEGASRSFVFVDEDTIRMFPRVFNAANRRDIAPAELEITELSLPSKKSSVSGGFEREALPFLRLAADGRYLVGTRDKRLTLHDGRTGTLLATLSEDLEAPKMRFLSGGRMAVAGIADGKGVLKIFLEGIEAPARPLDLGPAANVALGGEIAPGRVAVALNSFRSNDGRSQRAWKLTFVDVATGAVSPGPEGLAPADRFGWWLFSAMPPAQAGSPASKLFLD